MSAVLSSSRAQLQEDQFSNVTRGRELLEIFFYEAGKSENDWRWLEDIRRREDIVNVLGANGLDEISRRQDKHAPERNNCRINLLRDGDREFTILLVDMYEGGMVEVDEDLTQTMEVYDDRVMNGDRFQRRGSELSLEELKRRLAQSGLEFWSY